MVRHAATASPAGPAPTITGPASTSPCSPTGKPVAVALAARRGLYSGSCALLPSVSAKRSMIDLGRRPAASPPAKHWLYVLATSTAESSIDGTILLYIYISAWLIRDSIDEMDGRSICRLQLELARVTGQHYRMRRM
jgi:hypothetical protein